jgi:CRISPR/Cas system-associated exonuclease Cas4 (RecB family)
MSTYDTYLSYTGFKKYVTCPQSYYQEYIQKKRPPMEDQRNVLNGNALHNLLEEYIELGENDPTWFHSNVRRVWRETLDKCDTVNWRHDDDAQDLLNKAIKWSISMEKLFIDFKFDVTKCQPELKADTIVQVGPHKLKMAARLDVVTKNSRGDHSFFDLKASENKAVMEFDQIVWYSIVLGEYLGDKTQPKYGGYILPGFDAIKVYEVPDEAKRKLLARLEEVLNRIKAEVWTPIPNDKNCYWCPVKYVCPAKGALIPHGGGMIHIG